MATGTAIHGHELHAVEPLQLRLFAGHIADVKRITAGLNGIDPGRERGLCLSQFSVEVPGAEGLRTSGFAPLPRGGVQRPAHVTGVRIYAVPIQLQGLVRSEFDLLPIGGRAANLHHASAPQNGIIAHVHGDAPQPRFDGIQKFAYGKRDGACDGLAFGSNKGVFGHGDVGAG